MKRFSHIIVLALLLTTLLVPALASAQTADKPAAVNTTGDQAKKAEGTISKDEIDEITKQIETMNACQSAFQMNKGMLCLTEEEKQNNIYTVLETPLDTPDDTVQNNDGTSVKRCARFTQILNCMGDGKKLKKQSNQYLIGPQKDSEGNKVACPPEENLPGGLYGAGPNGSYYDCQEVTVILSPLEQGGIGFLNVYVSLIYRWAAGIIGVICVLIIVISGLQIITAQGEPSAVEEGKKRIIQSIGGIALLFLASGLLYMINPTFFSPPEYEPESKSIIEGSADVQQEDINNNSTVPDDQGLQDQQNHQNA